MNYQTCLDSLIQKYSNIEQYPVLGLYLKDPNLFVNTYIIIEEDKNISICKRDNTQVITINKSTLDVGVFKMPLYKTKKDKSKLFSLGNFEVYKKEVNA